MPAYQDEKVCRGGFVIRPAAAAEVLLRMSLIHFLQLFTNFTQLHSNVAWTSSPVHFLLLLFFAPFSIYV